MLSFLHLSQAVLTSMLVFAGLTQYSVQTSRQRDVTVTEAREVLADTSSVFATRAEPTRHHTLPADFGPESCDLDAGDSADLEEAYGRWQPVAVPEAPETLSEGDHFECDSMRTRLEDRRRAKPPKA
jgi:hypothetical protein